MFSYIAILFSSSKNKCRILWLGLLGIIEEVSTKMQLQNQDDVADPISRLVALLKRRTMSNFVPNFAQKRSRAKSIDPCDFTAEDFNRIQIG